MRHGLPKSRDETAPKSSKSPQSCANFSGRNFVSPMRARENRMDLAAAGDVVLFDGFRLDRNGSGLFRADGSPVPLGSRALAILQLLIERQGELVSKQQIMDAVWPGLAVEEGNLTVQMSALRKTLDQGRAEGSCIQTIPGRGYRFLSPVDVCPSACGRRSDIIARAAERRGCFHRPDRRPAETPSGRSRGNWPPSPGRVADPRGLAGGSVDPPRHLAFRSSCCRSRT